MSRPRPSILLSVADGVTAMLRAATLRRPLPQAERGYADWMVPLESITELLCDVVPVHNPKTELDERGAIKYSPQVDVVLRQRFALSDQDGATGRVDKAVVDELVALVEQINELFCGERMSAFKVATWETTDILAAFSKQHLRQHSQFTAVVRIGFSVVVKNSVQCP
jgi:hypothetical protein